MRRRDNEVREVRTQGGQGPVPVGSLVVRAAPQCRPCGSWPPSLVAVLTSEVRARREAFPSESASDSAAAYVDSFCRSSKAATPTPRSYAAAMPGKGGRTDSTAAGSCFWPRAELSEGTACGTSHVRFFVRGEATVAWMTRLASLSRTGTRLRSGSPSSTGTPSPSGSSRWPDLETGAAIRDGQAAGMRGRSRPTAGRRRGCLRHKSLRLRHSRGDGRR